MMTKSRAVAKKTAAVFLSVIVIGGGIYVLWLYETGQPPFCSGYPPGGDCPGNYSSTFSVSINYTGSWHASWYGYHSGQTVNYTGGTFSGGSPAQKNITLSGPNNNSLGMCVQAEKLDSSDNTLILVIGGETDNTSLPSGNVSLCQAVVP